MASYSSGLWENTDLHSLYFVYMSTLQICGIQCNVLIIELCTVVYINEHVWVAHYKQDKSQLLTDATPRRCFTRKYLLCCYADQW